MLDTNKVANFKQVTTKDLQDNIYQNIKQKYGERFYNYLLKHNRSEEVYVYLSRINSILATDVWDNGLDFLVLPNPQLNKDNSKLKFEQFLLDLINKFTLTNIINFAENMEKQSFFSNVIDPDLYFNWVMTNLDTILFSTGMGHLHNVGYVFSYFTNEQYAKLIYDLLSHFKHVQDVIALNCNCLNTLFTIIYHATKSGQNKGNDTTLLMQKITVEMLKLNFDSTIASNFPAVLKQVNNLKLNLPLSYFVTYLYSASNTSNYYTFYVDSEKDVNDFLETIRIRELNSLQRELGCNSYQHQGGYNNYEINLSGFEDKIARYRQALEQKANEFPACNEELEKLNLIFKKK